jgi:hypothetical protein
MSPQVKVDEELPKDVARLFSEADYIADTVCQQRD